MATLIWAISCQRAIIDRESNSATYVDSVEQLTVRSLPVSLPPLTIGMLWRRGIDEKHLLARIRFLGPDSKQIASHELPKYDLPKHRHRLNVVVGGYPVDKAGEYWFVIDQKAGDRWKRMTKLPVMVVLDEAE